MKWLSVVLLCWTIMVEKPTRVLDGDTFTADLEVWPNIKVTEHIRLLGEGGSYADAFEFSTEKGPAARAFATSWLQKGPFLINACKRDSFGRLLATVYRGNEYLADELDRNGYLVPKKDKDKPKSQ